MKTRRWHKEFVGAKSDKLLVLACCWLAGGMGVSDAGAQSYPAKPVRLIVPFVPGGSADFFGRLITSKLGESLGQQVLLDNRGGAGGTIGTETASRAAPDGYTLLLGTANTAMNVSLYGKRSVDPVKEFAAVSLLGAAPNILAVHPSLPVKTVKQLIALAKARPGQIYYASGGSGSTSHLATELFKTLSQTNLLHVPYKGTGPALTAVLSGEASVVIPPASVVLPHSQLGKLRALAIGSSARLETMPDMPTIAEAGVPGYEASQWYGVLAPAGTPRAVIDRLNRDLVRIVQAPEFKAQLLKQVTTTYGSTPEEFAAYLKDEIAKWDKVVRFSGARVE